MCYTILNAYTFKIKNIHNIMIYFFIIFTKIFIFFTHYIFYINIVIIHIEIKSLFNYIFFTKI